MPGTYVIAAAAGRFWSRQKGARGGRPTAVAVSPPLLCSCCWRSLFPFLGPCSRQQQLRRRRARLSVPGPTTAPLCCSRRAGCRRSTRPRGQHGYGQSLGRSICGCCSSAALCRAFPSLFSRPLLLTPVVLLLHYLPELFSLREWRDQSHRSHSATEQTQKHTYRPSPVLSVPELQSAQTEAHHVRRRVHLHGRRRRQPTHGAGCPANLGGGALGKYVPARAEGDERGPSRDGWEIRHRAHPA